LTCDKCKKEFDGPPHEVFGFKLCSRECRQLVKDHCFYQAYGLPTETLRRGALAPSMDVVLRPVPNFMIQARAAQELIEIYNRRPKLDVLNGLVTYLHLVDEEVFTCEAMFEKGDASVGINDGWFLQHATSAQTGVCYTRDEFEDRYEQTWVDAADEAACAVAESEYTKLEEEAKS
jgi:hypothetical protein